MPKYVTTPAGIVVDLEMLPADPFPRCPLTGVPLTKAGVDILYPEPVDVTQPDAATHQRVREVHLTHVENVEKSSADFAVAAPVASVAPTPLEPVTPA